MAQAICARCGTSVTVTPSRVRERNYCSRECHYASMKGAPQPAKKSGKTKTCEVCGGEFYVARARASKARFCSMKCKGVASRAANVCATCGATFAGPKVRKFCSRECAAVGHRSGETRACRQCGSEFYVVRGRVEQGDGWFCSIACHNEHQGRGKTEHTCKTCGKVFRWSPSRSASGAYKITYCSLACRDVAPDWRAMLLAMNERQQSGKLTCAEVAGYAMLDAAGVEYQRQATFAGKFIPDAVVPAVRLVVQFDGDYWHDRKGASTEPRILRRVAQDHSQDAYVRACGWEVARFWDSDLRDNLAACAERLSQLLHRPLGDEPSRNPLARESGPTGAGARAA